MLGGWGGCIHIYEHIIENKWRITIGRFAGCWIATSVAESRQLLKSLKWGGGGGGSLSPGPKIII